MACPWFTCAHGHVHSRWVPDPWGPQALTNTQHDEGRVLPAGQQQQVDQVVGDEAEAQDHAAPLLEALACGDRRPGVSAAWVAKATGLWTEARQSRTCMSSPATVTEPDAPSTG